MIVNLNEVLKRAQKEKYAVGLFNTTDTDMLQAVTETAEGSQYLYEDEQQYPSHTTEDDGRREAGRDEVAGFAAVGLSYEHQHGRVESGAKVEEAVYIGNSCDV